MGQASTTETEMTISYYNGWARSSDEPYWTRHFNGFMGMVWCSDDKRKIVGSWSSQHGTCPPLQPVVDEPDIWATMDQMNRLGRGWTQVKLHLWIKEFDNRTGLTASIWLCSDYIVGVWSDVNLPPVIMPNRSGIDLVIREMEYAYRMRKQGERIPAPKRWKQTLQSGEIVTVWYTSPPVRVSSIPSEWPSITSTPIAKPVFPPTPSPPSVTALFPVSEIIDTEDEEDVDAAQPDASAVKRELSEAVSLVFASLTKEERTVLRMRFGIKHEHEHTLNQVGAYLGKTRERVRQIEARAFKKLRHPSRARFLKPFME